MLRDLYVQTRALVAPELKNTITASILSKLPTLATYDTPDSDNS